MKCCSCGQEIADGVRFCTICGAQQVVPAAEPEIVLTEDPVIEPVAEPVAAPTEELVVEPVTEAVAETVAETVAAPVAVAEPAPQHVAQPEPVAQPVYQTVYQTVTPVSKAPRYQLPDRRGLAKMFFLGLITCGIYNAVIMSRMAEEMNMVASQHDGRRTQQFAWVSMLSVLTLGVYPFVWIHGLCNRMGAELKRRGINYKFSAKTFWLWGILGSLLIGIGPFIYVFKLCKASNLINRDYNVNG